MQPNLPLRRHKVITLEVIMQKLTDIKQLCDINADNVILDLSDSIINCEVEFKKILIENELAQAEEIVEGLERYIIPFGINFSGSIFLHKANFSFLRFVKENNFNRVTFKGDVFFSNSAFNSEAEFSCVSFEREVFFDKAVFKNKAYFNNIVFNQNATFYNCLFVESSLFKDVVFKKSAMFVNANFLEKVDFNNSIFCCNVNFSTMYSIEDGEIEEFIGGFNRKILFSRTVFKGGVNFSFRQFKGGVSFLECEFYQEVKFLFAGFLNASFQDLILKEKGLINFKTVYELESNSHIEFRNINCDWHENLSRIRISKTFDYDMPLVSKFKKSPCFVFAECFLPKGGVTLDESNLNKIKTLNMEYWREFKLVNCFFLEKKALVTGFPFFARGLPNENSINESAKSRYISMSTFARTRWQTYAGLKQQLEADGDKQQAGEMHFWQMYWQLKESEALGKRHWVNWLYLHTSAYGLSIWRPLILWLLFSLTLFPWLYSYASSLSTAIKPFNWHEALELSFYGGVTLLSWSLEPRFTGPPGCLTSLLIHGLFAAQHVLSAYLLFQLASAIRHRVRR